MRIACIGAHGTGKTTLSRKLAALLGLPHLPETAREVADKMQLKSIAHEDLSREIAVEYQRQIMARQIAYELAHADTGFVSDRSVFDNLAYLPYRGLHTDPVYDELWAVARRHYQANPYDIVFFCRPFDYVPSDGFRFTCRPCQLLIDYLVQEMIPELYASEVYFLDGDNRYLQAKQFLAETQAARR